MAKFKHTLNYQEDEAKRTIRINRPGTVSRRQKMKSSAIAHAFIIGFMMAVVGYSIVKNTWGLLTLIPLFFIYQLTRNSNNSKELEQLLKERKLK